MCDRIVNAIVAVTLNVAGGAVKLIGMSQYCSSTSSNELNNFIEKKFVSSTVRMVKEY